MSKQIINLLPKNWSDISVSQFQELVALSIDDFDNDYFFILEQLSILLNTSNDDELFDDLEFDELMDIMDLIKWIKDKPKNKFIKEIDKYYFKELEYMTLGEFIDLEHYFSMDYLQNIHIICAILFKQKKINEWDQIIYEPYEYDVIKRSELFLELSIDKIYGIIDLYLAYKDNLLDIYQNLFEDPNFDKIENAELLDAEELLDIQNEIKEDKIKSKWNWESITYNLCNGDITKFNNTFNQPLILVLNVLSMKKVLDN